ncbi:MAG: tyrosine-type recombinase/integrase [Chloroflexi bacterium]|nr:tyrosine-type recombinase/integrase [Chloroflexota bacterium]
MANEIIVVGPGDSTRDDGSQKSNSSSKLELAIVAWLDAKSKRSNSSKTLVAYRDTLASFRNTLLAAGLDLDSPDITTLALVAQGWAGQSTTAAPSFIKEEGKGKGNEAANSAEKKATTGRKSRKSASSNLAQETDKSDATVIQPYQEIPRTKAQQNTVVNEVSPATYNQRLAILSSFYGYARRQGLLTGENPIGRVERRPVHLYGDASALSYKEVKNNLAAIDRSQPIGKRDYALLSVALQTGRRLSELASLRRSNLKFDGASITIHWHRTKGGKAMSDRLPQPLSRALAEWHSSYYGNQVNSLPQDAPVWVSLSRQNKGAALSIQTIADICEKRLGTSKVHSLRHTFARAMEDAGAKVSVIQARLGHTSLATTGRYLAALRQAENEHADALSSLFGIE